MDNNEILVKKCEKQETKKHQKIQPKIMKCNKNN